MMQLSEKIISLRKSRGMTQDDLSEALDVSRQSISKWESGQAMPDVSNMVAMAKVFGVSTDSLLIDDEAVDAQPGEATAQTPAAPAAPDTSVAQAASVAQGASVAHATDAPRKPKKKWLIPAIAAAAVVIVTAVLLATGVLGGRKSGDEEIDAAIKMGIVPEDMQHNYNQPATEFEMYQVLCTVAQKRFGATSESMMARYGAAVNRPLQRQEFAYLLLRTDVWENRGLSNLPLVGGFEMDWSSPDADAIWQASKAAEDYVLSVEGGGFSASYTKAARDLVDSLPEGVWYIGNEVEEWNRIFDEEYHGGQGLTEEQDRERIEKQNVYVDGDYVVPVVFASIQRSTVSSLPLMDLDKDGNFRTKAMVTRGEVIRAAYRLYYTW